PRREQRARPSLSARHFAQPPLTQPEMAPFSSRALKRAARLVCLKCSRIMFNGALITQQQQEALIAAPQPPRDDADQGFMSGYAGGAIAQPWGLPWISPEASVPTSSTAMGLPYIPLTGAAPMTPDSKENSR